MPIERVGLKDTFAETGPYFPMLEKYGLGVKDISAAAEKAIQRRGKTV